MKTNYEQIVDITKIGHRCANDMNEIIALGEQERFSPAVDDAQRRLLLCIDVQNDFIEGGSLPVSGSVKDVENITKFIYNNMGGITKIMCSQDTHSMRQIFFPCWWVNSAGDHPDPYTIITNEDIANNRWRAIVGPLKSEDYLKGLKSADDKKQLCIWPYHCLAGTPGQILENEFAKMVYFHESARKSKTVMIPKGTDPYSEMYGIIKPEYSKKNFLNTPVLTAIEKYDEIYVVGEAASHCLMESVKQIAEHFDNRPEVTQKITILEDCTSPIPGYEADTTAAFNNFKSSYGIKFAKSTDIQF